MICKSNNSLQVSQSKTWPGYDPVIINVFIDLDKFELVSELPEDELNTHGHKSGDFTTSDGTEYTYSFHYGMNIQNKSDIVKIN